MYFGTTKINEMYFGASPIIEVWLGATKVWENNPEWTYEIDDLSVNYFPTSQGEVLRPDASNYANVIGRVKSYKNGVLQETKPVVQLPLTTTSPFVTISNDRLYFNIEDYGLVDMSQSNPFGITDVKYNFSGTTGYCPTIYVEPNKIASTAYTEFNCYGTTSISYLAYNQTTFTITNKNSNKLQTTYTSGRSTITTKNVAGYLFEEDGNTGNVTLKATMAYNGNVSINVGGPNVNSYPVIYRYRLSHLDTMTGHDYFIYMIHKCQNNTTGMQMYYGTQKVDGMTIESSAYSYIANNGHTIDTTYTWTASDNGIDIETMNGVFKIYCDSSTSGDVTIYDNKGNYCSFSINS